MSILGYLIVFSVVLLLATVWVWCLINIVARPDLGIGAKVLWLIGTLVFPIVGVVAYIIFTKKRGPVDDTAAWEDKSAEEIEADAYRASHMTATDRAGDRPLL
jgi:predicted membrane channel-forming protein YqfA (hemolysin III family)